MSKTYQKLLKYEPILHVLFWFCSLFYQYLKFMENDSAVTPAHCFTELGFNMITAYALYFWLLPTKNKALKLYGIPLIFICNAWVYLHIDDGFHLEDQLGWESFLIILIRHITISLFFYAWFSIKELYNKQQEIETITTKEQQAQLRVLKGQINPHFLFNTLNTIYASALEKDDMTPDLILRLSDNFRYLLHEGQKNEVTLATELRHLKDYVDLQKQRWSKKVIVNWIEDIDDIGKKIPPLLLISFVENAFKYSSMLTGDNHEINIMLTLKDNTLQFKCDNTFSVIHHDEIDLNWQKSGVGIQNVKKRLALLFPKHHELVINADDSKFIVDLNIDLSCTA